MPFTGSMRPEQEPGMTPGAEEGINPRPVVLGVCFFWGVACGFLLNAVHKSRPQPAPRHAGTTARTPERKRQQLTPEMQRIKARQVHRSEVPEVKPPGAIEEVKMAEPPAPGEAKEGKGMIGEYPPLPKPALDPTVGLTGRTADKPVLPLDVKEGPAPPLPAATKFEEVEPPDLD